VLKVNATTFLGTCCVMPRLQQQQDQLVSQQM
jgi:hypothetical protein